VRISCCEKKRKEKKGSKEKGSSLCLAHVRHGNIGNTSRGSGSSNFRTLGTMSRTGADSMKRSSPGRRIAGFAGFDSIQASATVGSGF
jgi:hypothetical protein